LKREPLKPGRVAVERRSRLPEDTPPFAVDYYIRLAAVAALHEGNFSAVEIAEIIGGDVKNVANHLRDLYDAGCIEFVGYAGEGNMKKAVFRAISRPLVSDEEYLAMSFKQRRDLNGTALQWIMTECLASYRSGKMNEDDDLCLLSDEPNLDAEGKIELRELLLACWSGESTETLETIKAVQEIACRAAKRMAESKETGTKIVVVLMAFERGRSKLTERESFTVRET